MLTIFKFESQLMQYSGARDTVIYRPDPGHFLFCKSPGTGHTFRVPGEMVTGQLELILKFRNSTVTSFDNSEYFSTRLANYLTLWHSDLVIVSFIWEFLPWTRFMFNSPQKCFQSFDTQDTQD